MNIYEIDGAIQLAVSYKHSNMISLAIEIEEECLDQCKLDVDTPLYGFGILFKALGKLYLIDHQFEKASQFFSAAVEAFSRGDINSVVNNNDSATCIYFLGYCHPDIMKTQLFADALIGLQKGEINPETPLQKKRIFDAGLNLHRELSLTIYIDKSPCEMILGYKPY